jgi:hypothetical protein
MPVIDYEFAWIVGHSGYYGAPFVPVFFSDDKAECEKWLEVHKGQYATGATVVMSGKGFMHKKEQ